MDKGLTKQLLVYNNLPTPKGFVINKTSQDKTLEAHGLSVPCVVKPSCGGSSVGVSIVKTWEEYNAALDEAFKYENEVIVEEFIGGREFSIGVVGGRALPIIEIIPKEGFYDYENKYLPGKTEEICPAELDVETTKKMQDCAVAVSYALRLEAYCRIDFILKPDGEFYCLEANTLPGMTATSLIPQEAAADGDDFQALCQKLIKLSLAKYDN
jgi:D-alanine-D-alanine ligase